MIDLSLYPKFKKDIDSPHINIHYLFIIGWDRQDDTASDFGSPVEDSIFISQRKETFDNVYYGDYDLRIPTISEVQDFNDNKYKINNMNIKLSNYEVDGERFSDRLGGKSYYNASCILLYKSPSCTELKDCMPAYLGLVRKIDHSDTQVNISIEDFAEHSLDSLVPKSKMVATNMVPQQHKNQPIPMTYGKVEKVPVPFTVNEGTAPYISQIKLYVDSKNYHLPSAFQSSGTAVGSEILRQDPVYIFDGSFFNVVRRTNELENPLLEENYGYGFGENDAPRIVFQSHFQESDLTDQENITEENYYINDTHNNNLRLQVFKPPTQISQQTNGQWWSYDPQYVWANLNSYSSEADYENQIADVQVKWEKGYGDTESFIQLDSIHSPSSVSGEHGTLVT